MTPFSLSIVIPCYNEERRLGGTLSTVAGYLDRQSWSWEIRVVDDGSEDATADVGEAFAVRDPRVVVQREPHRGKGGAVKAGLMSARAAFRFICDADLSMPIHEIARFLPPLSPPCDVAIGTREGVMARRIGEPLYRHLLGRAFNRGVQWLVLPGIEDSQCGFKMFSAHAVELIFPRVSVDGWAFDVEALTVARSQRLRIAEVPIEWHYRADSRLKLLRDGWSMGADLVRIRRRAVRRVYDI